MSLLELIIGVLGIVLGILFFCLQRIKKYPAQLSYTVLDCSRIVGKSDSGFNGVSLHYNDYVVNNDLYYVKIHIFNQRSSDVRSERGGSSIAIELDDNSNWIDVRVKEESPNVLSEIAIIEENNRIAELSFHLLKKGEYITVEGLIESGSALPDNEEQIIKINHRIAQLDTFEFIPLVTERRYNWCKKIVKIYGSILCFVLIFLALSFFLPRKSSILYRVNNNPKDNTEYYVSVDKEGNILAQEYRLFMFQFSSGSIISDNEFESNYYPTYTFHESGRFYLGILLFLFIILLCVLLLYDFVRDIHRYRVLSKYRL